MRELYGGADDGVYVKRIADPDGDDYGSDFETEDAMRSLLVEEVEGVCILASLFHFSSLYFLLSSLLTHY